MRLLSSLNQTHTAALKEENFLICDFCFGLVVVWLVWGLWLFCVPPTAFRFSLFLLYLYSYCHEL